MGHHPDCDGWRYVHAQKTEGTWDRRRLVCVDDGPVTDWVGRTVSDTQLSRMASCQSGWVSCDGSCLMW